MKKPLLSELTLREKIGQMLAPMQWDIYGKVEMTYDFSNSNLEDVKALCEKEQFGVIRGEQVGVYYADPKRTWDKKVDDYNEGMLMNTRIRVNSTAYREFLAQQISFLKIPPLVGGDCALGASNVFEDLSSIVSAAAIGAADSEELTFALGAAVAREMRCGGHNWRWCPVLDLGNRNSSSVMRTFAVDDPDRTVRLAKAYFMGMQSEGVAATAKHFPSEGRTEARDAHFSSTSCPDSMEVWWSEQGKVYQEIFDAGVYSVMVGHQSFPAMDDTMINGRYVPATISRKIVTDLLKGEMGFKGVVITDGIGMAGLYSLLPYEELIVALVNAGNDVILGAKLPSGDLIEQAVLDGRISMSRIDDACQRVLDMKEKLGMFQDGYYDLPYEAKDVVAETRRISTEIAKRSITLVRDRHSLLPLDKTKIKKVAVIVSSHSESFLDDLEPMKKAFENRGIEVYMQRRLKSTSELKAISDDSDLIIYAAYVQMHCPAGALRLFGEECLTYYHAFNHGKEKSIGVSFGYPYVHYDTMENADAFVNAYCKSEETQIAFVEAILGEIDFVGNSPVLLVPRANSI